MIRLFVAKQKGGAFAVGEPVQQETGRPFGLRACTADRIIVWEQKKRHTIKLGADAPVGVPVAKPGNGICRYVKKHSRYGFWRQVPDRSDRKT